MQVQELKDLVRALVDAEYYDYVKFYLTDINDCSNSYEKLNVVAVSAYQDNGEIRVCLHTNNKY